MDKEPESGSSSQEAIGSVKQAVNFYGGRQDLRNKPPSRAKELHMAKREITQFNEIRRVADYNRVQAQSELSSAKNTVKELSQRIEESKSKTRNQKLALERLIRSERREDERPLIVAEVDNHRYTEVMKELESVKQELSKLKLDMAYLLETKARVDKETEASTSRMRSYSNSIEDLKQEIEEANEEQVLVELARLEALGELADIESQRAAEATEFSFAIENTKKKINEVSEEIERSKELETQLAITTSDIDLLQDQLQLVKVMGESFKRRETSEETDKDELEEAKKELESIKEEGFQLMASMDIIRNEIQHVTDENTRLRVVEKRTEATIQNLNFKLLRAKAKMESVISAEEKARSIVSNMSATLEQITSEAEAAKKENQIIMETAAKIRAEKEKMEAEIDSAEERLRVGLKELEEVRASEALSLQSLKNVSEKMLKERVLASQYNSTITISNFEYKYLCGQAEGVEELADKKVAAAQAWIEAIKASEKEILMKTEIALRELRELKIAEQQEEVDEPAKVRPQTREKHRKSMKFQIDDSLPRKSIKDYTNSAAAKRSTPRRPSSPGGRHMNRSGSITLKKKPKIMPNLGKLFGSNRS
ncbi:hypothetical protein ACHQM5_005557 [Ranunculus cassubicifolius]